MFKKISKIALLPMIIVLLTGCQQEVVQKLNDETVSILNARIGAKSEKAIENPTDTITFIDTEVLDNFQELKVSISKLSDDEKKVKLNSFDEEWSEELNNLNMNSVQLQEYFQKKINLVEKYMCKKFSENRYNEFASKGMVETYSKYTSTECPNLVKLAQNVIEKKEAEQLAQEKAEADRITKEKAKAEQLASEQLSLAKSKGYDSYEAYKKGEAERIAKAEKLAKQQAEVKRKAQERAARTKTVSRDELNRVLTRPSKYIGQIIKFKDSVKWDYVTEFQMLSSGEKNYKFYQIYKMNMKGANWSSIEQPLLFMPKDIFDAIDNDFYDKTSKNFTDYYMQSNEMELITISGKNFTKMFGSKATGKYIYDTDTVVLITNIKIYNRKLGTYQTRMFNY